MSADRTQVEIRQPNWLPLPIEWKAQDEPTVEENDLFTKGEVVVFYPHQGTGALRSAKGSVVSFALTEMELVGPKGHSRFIEVGRRVGYDASHTADGLKVTKMKVY